ncbi:MAG: hypothetical protein JO029_12735 [Candidatus Eremiobacteraeota bacterium]|nr:hypothetical protein [Candidatus Eremiobacteraeota bacterium]MBV8285144.1 hypothetical protein [Candidatus Eremiobacteraeota bacterium]MBV8435139.1 hypothetical protein [Candidatus Eremiobacteraeota bacterium]MBV8654970.1 hypothetical protein [Candidatus Eremiobacteraeota bacterium]
MLDAALVAALMRDKDIRSCVESSGEDTPSAYVARDFTFQSLTLYSGERLVVVVGKSDCGWQGQGARVLIYERTQSGYRLVLSDFSLPEQTEATRDGTLHLAGHESVNTIAETTYKWNGTKYVFLPSSSSIYCVGPDHDNERPYELPIRFANGTSSTVLRGTAYENCGQDYSFVARAGQKVTIERLTPQPRDLRIPILLYFGDDHVASVGDSWSGTLAHSGTYVLSVYGTEQRGEMDLQPYAIRLTIR